MSHDTGTSPLPEIILSEREYETLSTLAAAVVQRMPEVAESLRLEIDRATVVESEAVPPGIVRLGSQVTYLTEGAERQVILVMPREADISAGRVSILTPIGAALIGLSAGQTMAWTSRDGRLHRLRVMAVEWPAANRA
jgi:regulator of nucleoside diphosphate kinase